jgi:hypothetical protein
VSRVAGVSGRPPRFKMLTWEEIKILAPISWLVDHVVPAGGLVLLYGPSGIGKTFAVLDLALSVAAGEDWLGHRTMSGGVVYVAAEPAPLRERIGAWLQDRGLETPGSFVAVQSPVQLHHADDVATLVADLRAQVSGPVALIILDTLARCFVEGEENNAKDVGELVAGADRLRAELGCAVVLVHHPTKDGTDYRGSGALHAAVNTTIEVAKPAANTLTLLCKKQKDAVPFAPITARLQSVADTLVLRAAGPGTGLKAGPRETLRLLADAAMPLRWGEWKLAAERGGIPEGTFNRHHTELVRRELVAKYEDRYVLSQAGREVSGFAQAPPGVLQLPASRQLPSAPESARPTTTILSSL